MDVMEKVDALLVTFAEYIGFFQRFQRHDATPENRSVFNLGASFTSRILPSLP